MRAAHLQVDEEHLAEFCRLNRIRRLSLFGSILREDFGPDSDVDVLVEFEPGKRLGLEFFTLQDQLSAIVGREVDLNTPEDLSRYFRDQVLRSAEVVFDSEAPGAV